MYTVNAGTERKFNLALQKCTASSQSSAEDASQFQMPDLHTLSLDSFVPRTQLH